MGHNLAVKNHAYITHVARNIARHKDGYEEMQYHTRLHGPVYYSGDGDANILATRHIRSISLRNTSSLS